MMKPDNRRVLVTTAGRASAMMAAFAAGEQVAELAEQRQDPANAQPGDQVLTDDRSRRYHLEHHSSGGKTWHREVKKVKGKAARKADKRKRQQERLHGQASTSGGADVSARDSD
jgi:hypothetical protein